MNWEEIISYTWVLVALVLIIGVGSHEETKDE